MTMKGSDLLPIFTYDSCMLSRNPDLIFLTSFNIEETNTVKRLHFDQYINVFCNAESCDSEVSCFVILGLVAGKIA